ncbi:hypothetical protein COP2_025167 [Malus domestica]
MTSSRRRAQQVQTFPLPLDDEVVEAAPPDLAKVPSTNWILLTEKSEKEDARIADYFDMIAGTSTCGIVVWEVDARIADYFDMIAGTSTGGLVVWEVIYAEHGIDATRRYQGDSEL